MRNLFEKMGAWYKSLDSKKQWIAIGVAAVGILALILLLWFFLGKLAAGVGAFVTMLVSGGAGYGRKEAKDLEKAVDMAQQRKNAIRKGAVAANEQATALQNKEVQKANQELNRKNQATDAAAIEGDDNKLIQQAMNNADEILDEGEKPTVEIKIHPHTGKLKSLILPFLPLLFSLFGLAACSTVGAAGSGGPGVTKMMSIERVKFHRIVKSQQMCLRDLKVLRASKKADLIRERNTAESNLEQCQEDLKLEARKVIALGKRGSSNWLPWVLLGMTSAVSGVLIIWLSSKAFPIKK